MTTEVNKLSDYGNSFQLKLIAALISEKKFVQQIHDILEKEYFESESNQFIIDVIKRYYVKYKVAPSLDNISIIAKKQIQSDVAQIAVVDTLQQIKKFKRSADLPFVQEEALQFCKNKTLKSAILESVELLPYGDYDTIKNKLDKAFKCGFEKYVGHIYKDSIVSRYEESVRSPIKTPWKIINDLLAGGLGAGDLGVIVAPAGVGKSWVLTALGAYALKEGKTVLHYTMELSEEYTGMRYDSCLTKIAFSDIKYHLDEVERKCKNLKGNLIIREYNLREASTLTLRANFEDVTQLLGVKPDLIIIDYADRMKSMLSDKNTRADKVFGNLYDEIKSLAKELQVPIWTASQTNREGSKSEVVEGNTISDSFEKLMVADFVMSLSRQARDKVAQTGRVHIIKNRYGPDGFTYPASINTNFGHIEIYDSQSIEGKETTKNMGTEDNPSGVVKKYLNNKFREFNKTKTEKPT